MAQGNARERISPTSEAQGPEVSIVVPVYRNKETLDELYRRLRTLLDADSFSFEIVFVDDACPEGSLAVLQKLARGDPRVTVLAFRQNVGQQRAVLAGLGRSRGKWVVVMDADLQDPPEAIPKLLEKLQEGPAAVFATRRGRYESPSRLLTSRLFKWLLHLLCGVPMGAGLFLAMNLEMVVRLRHFEVRHPFIVAMIGCCGLPMASIPVVRNRRPVGQSAYTSWGRLKIGVLAITWLLSRKGRRVGRELRATRENVR